MPVVKHNSRQTEGPLIFNGTFTIQNRRTKERRTFKIATQPMDSGFAPGSRVISLLTGPDNNHSFTGFGFVTDAGINLWSRFRNESLWNGYAHMAWYILSGIQSPIKGFDIDNYEVFASKTCLVCNRKLTTPRSVKIGIGPICEAGGSGV